RRRHGPGAEARRRGSRRKDRAARPSPRRRRARGPGGGAMRMIRFFTLLLLLGVSAWAYHHNPDSPGYELLPDMARSVPYDAFAPTPVTRDGLTYQLPVVGTIARGAPLPFHYAATTQDAERAGRELRNPYPHTREVLARGHAIYTTFCTPCHGPMGAGDG